MSQWPQERYEMYFTNQNDINYTAKMSRCLSPGEQSLLFAVRCHSESDENPLFLSTLNSGVLQHHGLCVFTQVMLRCP